MGKADELFDGSKAHLLPDCMVPDGGNGACAAYLGLETRLAAAEQESDEFKESYRLAMVSVNDAYDKGKAFAEKERDELRAECKERVAEKMDFLTEVGTLRAENDRLAGEVGRREYQRNVFGQIIGELAVLVGVAKDVPMTGPELLLVADGLKSQLTAAQQSAKDRYWKGYADGVVDQKQSAKEQFRALEEVFALAYEAYSKPCADFARDDIYICFVTKRIRAIYTKLQAIRALSTKGGGDGTV